MTQSDDELQLVERAREGDQSAISVLYRRYERRAYNLALRMTGNPWDAADATQDAFIKAFRALNGFRGQARFGTWLHRIVVNSVHDQLRVKKGEPFEETELDRAAYPHSPEGSGRRAAEPRGVDPVTDGLSDTVRRALLSLDEGFRLAVVLCDILGFSYTEAGEILEVREGTVKSRIFRARRELGRLLEEEGYRHESPAPAGNPVHDPSVLKDEGKREE